MRPIAILARALLALAAATPVAQAAFSQPVATGERHFLWEVSSLTNHAWLYGTVHAGKASWFPLPRVVEEAFEDSQVLVVEADITDVRAMARTAPAMKLKAPDVLKNHVDAGDYAKFITLLPRYSLTERAVSDMKPFMAVSVLVFGEWGRNGYQPQYGIDAYLIQKAREEKKPVVEIEGVDAQAQLMDSLTDDENRKLFKGTVGALDSGMTSDQVNGMVAAWQSGDPNAMLQIARKYNDTVPGAKEFEDKFIWSRHDAMLEKIEGYLNSSRERHFIALGSLHFAGERGLVEMLRKRGYVVTQR
jgi:uncharacterized protein YbaP (TraB family)